MPKNVHAIIDDLTQGLLELKAALAPLSVFGGSAATPARRRRRGRPRTTAPQKPSVTRKQPRRAVSAKVRAGRKLQGKYMAAVRLLTPAQRAQVKAVRQKSGAIVAIAHAKKLKK